MKETKIEWAHATFNPWWGCVEVSPGCRKCYARDFDRRTHGTSKHVTASGETREPHWGKDAPRRFFGEKHWREPLRWDAAAKAAGERRRVFCASMADVFEDRTDLVDQRRRLALLIAATPNLDWLLLTKRPENVLALWPWGFPPNVWLGTTCEDQQRADERIPHLLAVPAAVRFLSVEPMLGPVDLGLSTTDRIRRFKATRWAGDRCVCQDGPDACPGTPHDHYLDRPPHGCARCSRCSAYAPAERGIDWVIVGGESGHGARPFDVAWARDIVRQTREAGVACFVKQLGGLPLPSVDGVEGPWPEHVRFFTDADGSPARLRDPKGGDPSEWPEGLRVRQFPKGGAA